jgi:prepilin-type processing-associated H-X9-DG protein
MNGYMLNTAAVAWLMNAKSVVFMNTRHLTSSSLHWSSIYDDFFDVWIKGEAWLSLPAARHKSGGNFGFADSHAETKKWQDERTRLAPIRGRWLGGLSPCSIDTHPMQAHTTHQNDFKHMNSQCIFKYGTWAYTIAFALLRSACFLRRLPLKNGCTSETRRGSV